MTFLLLLSTFLLLPVGCWGFANLLPKASNPSWRTASAVSSSSRLLASQADLAHAREVFVRFDENESGTMSSAELLDMLSMLDIAAEKEEADALCKYLDVDGDGEIDIEDFLPWYGQAVDASRSSSDQFQSLLIGRRTVDHFDQTPVADDVLLRAIQCAIAAPNRRMSEPWRFIQAGPATVAKFAQLHQQKMVLGMETDSRAEPAGPTPAVDWSKIPGWCVVTTKLTPGDESAELEDYKSTCCAIQNFMLSMWSEGIGTKWTSGPVQKTREFADLCHVDTSQERVVGCIWYGFATGGLVNADPKRRIKSVNDVLRRLP